MQHFIQLLRRDLEPAVICVEEGGVSGSPQLPTTAGEHQLESHAPTHVLVHAHATYQFVYTVYTCTFVLYASRNYHQVGEEDSNDSRQLSLRKSRGDVEPSVPQSV